MAARPLTPTQQTIAKRVIRVLSRLNTWAYRRTNGRIGGTYLHGAPVLLLTVVGRKTGRRLTAPLTYVRDGERRADEARREREGADAEHARQRGDRTTTGIVRVVRAW